MDNPAVIQKRVIRIPSYTLGEELFNAISHGIGALLSIAALVLMIVRAHGALPVTTVSLFGSSLILLYIISCVYHALSPRLKGKKVLRVLDHCCVFLLVLGTYIPVSLIGVGGALGWVLFGIVCFFAILGIVLTAVNLERFQVPAVICQLISGWSILIGLPGLTRTMGRAGILYLLLGGIMYSIGAVLYGVGSKKKYTHCVFHIFCLLGSFCHFWCVFQYLL